jgi:hypothetical protein
MYFVRNTIVRDFLEREGHYCGTVANSSGRPHGNGTMIYQNGDIFGGSWKHGMWHGEGTHKSGDCGAVFSYEGHRQGNTEMGKSQSIVACPNALVCSQLFSYSGSWEHGLRHGCGRLKLPGGACYEGECREGIIAGKGKMVWGAGSWFEGDWLNRLMHEWGK